MLGSWEIEVNARYARERIMADVAAVRPIANANRATATRLALARCQRLIGRGLIAVGERLAGQPAPGRAAVGRLG